MFEKNSKLIFFSEFSSFQFQNGLSANQGQARWRDYFDDDWDPDDDDRTVDDEDRSVEDDNCNLDDEDEKKKVKKGQARWRIHLHF